MSRGRADLIFRSFDDEAQDDTAERRRKMSSFQRQRRWLLDELNPPPGALLDLGCGVGALFPDLVATGRQIIGIDGSARSIEIAKQAWGARVKFTRGEAESLPVDAGSCGAVLALGLFEYLSNPSAVLAEIHRVLAPGGQLLLTLPAATDPYHRIGYALSVIKHTLTGSEPSIVA